MQATLPRVIVTGMPRAGSTRLYNIIREAMTAADPAARHGHLGDDGRLEAALEDPAPGLFKEHTFREPVAERIRHGDLRAVATTRDPLAVLVSLTATFGRPPEVAAMEVEKALACMEGVADQAQIYTYSTATDPNPLVVRRILRDVGVSISLPTAARLSHRWSRRNSKRRSDSPRYGGYDPVTLLHPAHVSDGRRDVSPEVASDLARLALAHDFVRRVHELEGRARRPH